MKSVLVVDDDPDQAEIMVQLLEGQKTKVRAFSDPLRALAELAKERADLLIADLSMPWIDGTDVIKSARLRQPDLVIFLVSGYSRGAEIAKERGIRFFAKPVDVAELRASVEQVLSSAGT